MSDFWLALSWREPLWLLLALIPLLLAGLSHTRRRKLAAYADPHLLPWAIAEQAMTPILSVRRIATFVAWLLLSMAVAGPRSPLEQAANPLQQAQQRHALTLMVVLDISASMAVSDIAPDRLSRARLELTDLLQRLRGERIGLVVFAGEAGMLLPPTDDTALISETMARVESGLLTQQGTNISAALNLASAALKSEKHRAVLLVTDGDADSFSGAAGAAAQQAAANMAQAGIALFVLGVGSEAGAAIPLPDGGFAEKDGVQVVSRLGTEALSDLARTANGHFARAQDGAADWSALYNGGIARLPGDAVSAAQAKAWREWFGVPLVLSLLLFMVAGLPAGKQWNFVHAAPLLLLLACLAATPQPAFADSLESQAWTFYQAQQYGEARTHYLQQGGYAGHMGAGAAAWQLKDYAGAGRYFGTALIQAHTDKQRSDALYNLGNAHFGQGNWLAAVGAYRTVLLQRPGDSRAQNNLAHAERQLEKQRQQQRDPPKSDLLGRRGMLVQGQVLMDWDRETVVKEFAPEPAGVQINRAQKNLADAQLGTAEIQARKIELDARRLQSGLRKMQLLEDRPRLLLQGLLKQDRQTGTTNMELVPW